MNAQKLPEIIQGGMGIGVSSVKLARTVSKQGFLGVISGTALAASLVRKLKESKGVKRIVDAIHAFPFPKIAKRILNKYAPSHASESIKNRFRPLEMPSLEQSEDLTELIVVANFVEVYLAKKGHDGVIGINLLEKIQIPTLPSIYGAMLASVDYVIMGAGIPKYVPSVLDQFVKGEKASMPIKVANDQEPTYYEFDPILFAKGETLPKLNRPKFLAIISSNILALHLMRNPESVPDGFIVEKPIAGGHNAAPRGQLVLDDLGEPLYGEKDEVNFAQLQKTGLPFWIAGGYGNHQAFLDAKELGAVGIQVGTAFAFSKESGMSTSLKERIIESVKKGISKVKTDLFASPTGFPFKVVNLKNTVSESSTYEKRQRICDVGYLREPYRKDDGKIGYRCPSEPVNAYVAKGGTVEETNGRKCLCNGLLSTIGLGQKKKEGDKEPPIITAGNDLDYILSFLKPGEKLYSALDVLSMIVHNTLTPLKKI